jgi:putative ABC transport system ATP-binding protein
MTVHQTDAREALAVAGLTKTYGAGLGAVEALAGVDLAFRAGTFTAVMGPSGSGKSTFLNCAAGLDAPTGGAVRIGGRDVTSWSESQRTELRRTHIGLVFQSFHLLPYLTAEQNVGLPLRLAGKRADRAWIHDLLDRFGLRERARHLPAQLSGGQQQRVAIARALVTRPAVVLADEPTGALDTGNARAILALLRDSVDELAQTVVMVTHDPVAASCADAAVFLVDGRVAGTMQNPTADAVAGQMAHLDTLVPGARP